jgi:hypothetical protein
MRRCVPGLLLLPMLMLLLVMQWCLTGAGGTDKNAHSERDTFHALNSTMSLEGSP